MKTTARHGYAVFPSLTIHGQQVTARGAASHNAGPIQPWSVVAWLEAIVACEDELHAPDDWTASVAFDVSGVPTLSINSPPRYMETKASHFHNQTGLHSGDDGQRLNDFYEHESVSAMPCAVDGVHDGVWSAWDPGEGSGPLRNTQLRTLATLARKRRYSQNGRRGSAIFVLGSSDPEMEDIAEVIRGAGQRLIWGTKEGRRLRPGEDAEMVLPEGLVYLGVECAVNGEPATFDHHGTHPSASLPPAQYWEASSLGQVWNYIFGVHMDTLAPRELHVTAALDHCLAAACAGQCPGVSIEEARAGAQSRARDNFGAGLTDDEFAHAFATAVETLQAGEPSALGFDVVDLTHLPIDGPAVQATSEQYPSAFQFGPVVGAVVGRGYVVRIRRGDGRVAFRVGGCGAGSVPGEDPIHRWLEGAGVNVFGCHGPDEPRPNGLYGNAVRGFAGGTLREQPE